MPVEGERQGGALMWAVALPDGTTVNVWDLPFETVSTIAVDSGLASWATLVDHPIHGNMSAGVELYKAACRHAGQKPKLLLSVDDVYGVFRPVPDDIEQDEIDESTQWAIVLPDGTDRRLRDLEWALLGAVGDRHGWSVAAIIDGPRRGDGRLTLDLYRSTCENQRQVPAEGLSVREVCALFRAVSEDRVSVDDMTDDGLPDPKAGAGETTTT